jgi:lipoprotein-anchoring transpeptidase ErfK/SrfK
MRRIVIQVKNAVLTTVLILATHAAAQQSPREIVVSIPDRQLALVEEGQILRVYDVAVGADESPSPTGDFTIVNRLEDPTYYRPGVVIEPGAENPLGTRWMGLSQKGFGIHGTNVPSSIGKAASHGCIRMSREDLEELFSLVQVGAVVHIHAERDDEIAEIFPADDGITEVAAAMTMREPTTQTADQTADEPSR